MREQSVDRTVPVAVTLVVLALVVMTFDVRADGRGVVGTFRSGVNQVLAPFQAAASAVVDPLADLVDGIGDLAGLRAENQALRARLAAAQAELASVEDQLERLEVLEALLDLELDLTELTVTHANVIGRTDSFDLSFRIDKGEESGVLAGHPVLDQNGYLVGRVVESWRGGAIVVPLIGDRNAVTVGVGDQTGTLSAVIGSDEMVLEVFETARPVRAGDQVVTSPFSAVFPPSIPVGEIIEDAEPEGQALTARVRPYSDPTRLRAVAVVAWPIEPAVPAAEGEAGNPGG
ncbi:MAG: hypothetical protein KatS3mg011_1143 [Acidimicrobiia bacterium]|nr:MAG: hypothetical protein KatS3mg011_1143 [Acidimicrobiia bacterium]